MPNPEAINFESAPETEAPKTTMPAYENPLTVADGTRFTPMNQSEGIPTTPYLPPGQTPVPEGSYMKIADKLDNPPKSNL